MEIQIVTEKMFNLMSMFSNKNNVKYKKDKDQSAEKLTESNL